MAEVHQLIAMLCEEITWAKWFVLDQSLRLIDVCRLVRLLEVYAFPTHNVFIEVGWFYDPMGSYD